MWDCSKVEGSFSAGDNGDYGDKPETFENNPQPYPNLGISQKEPMGCARAQVLCQRKKLSARGRLAGGGVPTTMAMTTRPPPDFVALGLKSGNGTRSNGPNTQWDCSNRLDHQSAQIRCDSADAQMSESDDLIHHADECCKFTRFSSLPVRISTVRPGKDPGLWSR